MEENIKNNIKRTRGRPPILKKIADYIIGESRSIRNQNIIPSALAKVISNDLVWQAQRGEHLDNDIPTELTIKKKIEEARRYTSELDSVWSIAASIRYGIPSGDTQDLFRLLRYSLAIDRPLSIRQARWVVHLRTLYKFSVGEVTVEGEALQSLWLLTQSWLYSVREMSYEIMAHKKEANKPESFDTSDLDAVFMPSWERANAITLKRIPRTYFSQEQINGLKGFGATLESPPQGFNAEHAVWQSVYGGFKDYNELLIPFSNLTEEEDLVSAHWLSCFSKGSKWASLSPEKQKKVRGRLNIWVENHRSMSQSKYYSYDKYPRITDMDPELLKIVGYDFHSVDNDKHKLNIKEANNERENS